MALFDSNQEGQGGPPPPAAGGGPPVDLVLSMKQQGLTNNQIVQNLQRQGYEAHDIFDAMNQADIKGGVGGIPSGGQYPDMPAVDNPIQAPQPQGFQPQPPPPPAMGAPAPPPLNQAQPAYFNQSSDKERIEEIAESIIDEKWSDLMKSVEKIIAWKEKTESEIAKIHQEFDNLKESFANLQKGILGKVSEYDTHIASVGTEIKALEKVFQKILPTLTENVNELSRITSGMKKKK